MKLGDYAAAEGQLTAALAETDRSGSTERATVLNNLGYVYESMGRYAKAETCYNRAIKMFKKSDDLDAKFVRAVANLARVYVETLRLNDAERLGIRRLAAKLQLVRPTDPDLARLLSIVGILERSKSRFDEAERLQLQAMAVWTKLRPSGTEVLQTFNNLGLVYIDAGRTEDALLSFQRAQAIAETVLRPEDPVRARLLANIGTMEFRLHGPASAEPFYKRALEAAENALGIEHPLVGHILSNYEVALRLMKRTTEARECKRRAEAILADARAGAGKYIIDVRDLSGKTPRH